MRPVSRLAAAACCFALSVPALAAEPPVTTALTNARIVDLEGGAAIENAVLLVEGERIAAIGPANEVAVPPGAEVIDVGGAWLVPGLMSLHVHLGLVLPGKMEAELANNPRKSSNWGSVMSLRGSSSFWT